MTFKNKTLQKFLSVLLIISILSPVAIIAVTPKQVSADIPVIDIPNLFNIIRNIVVAILNNFLKQLARKLLDKITQSTINWINTGFHGSPTFIQNPSSFFTDIIHSQLRGFINTTAYNHTSYPFGTNYAIGVLNSAKVGFAQDAQYSLSKYNLDATQFAAQQKDFSVGGWGGLLMNTQNLQNNFLGYGIIADNEVDTQLSGLYSTPTQRKQQVSQGSGFLSTETCPTNPNWDPNLAAQGPDLSNIGAGLDDADYQAQVTAMKAAWQLKYGCTAPSTSGSGAPTPVPTQITTPGRVAADSIMNALGSTQRQGELSASVGNALSAIFDAVVQKLFTMGVSALSNTGSNANKNPATPDPLDVKLNTFNIYGDTSNGGSAAGYLGNPPTAKAPQITMTLNIVNSSSGVQTYDPGIIQGYLDNNAIKTNAPVTTTPTSITPVCPAGYTFDTGTKGCDASIVDPTCPTNYILDSNTMACDQVGAPSIAATCPTNYTIDANTLECDPSAQVPLTAAATCPTNYGISANGTSCDSAPHKLSIQSVPQYYVIITGDCLTATSPPTTTTTTNALGQSITTTTAGQPYGTFTVQNNDDDTCVFTLEAIPTGDSHHTGNFEVIAKVTNTSYGEATLNSLNLLVNGNPKTSGVIYKYDTDNGAGQLNVSVTLPDQGYTVVYGPGCDAQGNILVSPSCSNGGLLSGYAESCVPIDPATGQYQAQVCYVSLADIPGWHEKWETINVVVTNNNATTPGTLTPDQVKIDVDGSNITAVTPAKAIASGQQNLYTAGDSNTAPVHNVTPVPIVAGALSDYNVTYSGNCDAQGNFQLIHTNGATDPATGIETDVQTCTMTLDDK